MPIIIDFDSTFLQTEALEELAAISLAHVSAGERESVYAHIQALTNSAMEGKLSFHESLAQRMAVLSLHRDHLAPCVALLKTQVTPSFVRNRAFFGTHQGDVYIISNGFRELIEPVVADYGIDAGHVLANTFTIDEATGRITGFDAQNPLAYGRKSDVLRTLALEGEIHVIGDGYTDAEMRLSGVAHKFFLFTENIFRESVFDKADHVAPSFDEFLYVNKLPMTISYPKNRIKVLLLENVHPRAEEIFRNEGYQVEFHKDAMAEDELCEAVKGVHILGIRSKTQVTRRVVEQGTRLMAVGAFCIGTNQIDLTACAEAGVVAFNAPYSNTRSVVELAIGEIIALMRQLHPVSADLHQGKWTKSASHSYEVRGKKLGIVGYGNIGSQLSVLAENLGMEVWYYDVVEKLAMGNARKCASLEELLAKCDVVSLHVDGRRENTTMFGSAEFDAMKQGSIFLNLARGHVVDLAALKAAFESGKLLGAGIDVFPYEPKSNQETFVNDLRGIPNLILTPHIGGSTQEAQANIGEYVPKLVLDYINTGSSHGSVNFPPIQLPKQGVNHRMLHIHRNMPGILSKINRIFEAHGINIESQYLKTNEYMGYVITEVNRAYDEEVMDALRGIDGTIKFRVLY